MTPDVWVCWAAQTESTILPEVPGLKHSIRASVRQCAGQGSPKTGKLSEDTRVMHELRSTCSTAATVGPDVMSGTLL